MLLGLVGHPVLPPPVVAPMMPSISSWHHWLQSSSRFLVGLARPKHCGSVLVLGWPGMGAAALVAGIQRAALALICAAVPPLQGRQGEAAGTEGAEEVHRHAHPEGRPEAEGSQAYPGQGAPGGRQALSTNKRERPLSPARVSLLGYGQGGGALPQGAVWLLLPRLRLYSRGQVKCGHAKLKNAASWGPLLAYLESHTGQLCGCN